VNTSVAPTADEHEPVELPLQFALRREQLHSEALGRDHRRAVTRKAAVKVRRRVPGLST